MSLRRNIISLIMLLTYTLSFAHDIIPHYHSDISIINGVEFSDYSEHEKCHEHVEIEYSEKSNSVEHLDHSDNSLFDYVICLFESVEHGGPSNHELIVYGIDTIQLGQSDGVTLPEPYPFNSSFVESKLLLKETISTCYFKQQFVPAIIHLESRILRGPPIFSC